MTEIPSWKEILVVAGFIGAFVAAIDVLVLILSVTSGDQEAMANWITRHIESMIWLTVAEALGLTTVLGSLAGPLLKALVRAND